MNTQENTNLATLITKWTKTGLLHELPLDAQKLYAKYLEESANYLILNGKNPDKCDENFAGILFVAVRNHIDKVVELGMEEFCKQVFEKCKSYDVEYQSAVEFFKPNPLPYDFYSNYVQNLFNEN